MISAAQKLSTFLKKKVNSSSWTQDFLNQINGRSCLLCQQIHTQPYALCTACESDLPWLEKGCRHCGVPLPMTTESSVCAQCQQQPPKFDRCVGLFHYEFPLRELIGQYKFRNRPYVGRLLAELLSRRINQEYTTTGGDQLRQADSHPILQSLRPDALLVPPLHAKRLRERGFNQALEMGRIVSKKTGIPLRGQAFVKRQPTAPQSELGAQARARNLRGGFQLQESLPGPHIALIDDIVTTGHTVNELSRLLRKAGAKRIDVWCIARTPPPSR